MLECCDQDGVFLKSLFEMFLLDTSQGKPTTFSDIACLGGIVSVSRLYRP